LVKDMKEMASAKGCALHTDWQPYYLPNPAPEARQAFNEYVRCRWPIHVFALDPETQDQNLADSDATRREMQLALSLAFVSGQVSASNMTRYARRIDAQYDTIDINRTAVGFSHGEDTFGWRFYPRFQTPDTEGNATVLFRDMLMGGPNKDALLRERKLEPGMRECVAIVMMPSFVPYVTFDATSNWFRLANPKLKELDCKDALHLSRAVKSIQTCSGNVEDADCYRDGDLPRLLAKADQLSARLPLQTQSVQVPYENTLGGFQMFSTGVSDLAPELLGWYGAPYVDVNNPTTLFLVGNHFSVKQTRIVAGGVAIDPYQHPEYQEMLSRQVVRVLIPPGAQTIEDGGNKFVDVHIATPYGVTQHLLIPAIAGKGPSVASGYQWSPFVDVTGVISLKKDKTFDNAVFTLPDGLKELAVVNNSAVPDADAPKSASLVLRLTKLQDGTTVPFGNADPIDLTFANRRAPVTLDALTAAVKKLPWADLAAGTDAKVLLVNGKLTIGKDASAVSLPLDNVLRFQITVKVAPN
jgi:hypothetical protein